MIAVEIENRSGTTVDRTDVVSLARAALASEGIESGDLGIVFVRADEMRALKREHLGVDETTDVLSFPIDAREEIGEGVPRQLGDVVLCPDVVGEDWRWPLVHGLLHLVGYEHGEAMKRRETELIA